MQVAQNIEPDAAHVVGWDLRIMLLSADPAQTLADRIASLGSQLDRQQEVYTALSGIIDDPRGYGLFIMECDSFGGGDAGTQAARTLAAAQIRVPVILISKEHQEQIFPQDRNAPICLRAPLSTLSLRVGLEHALRDRLIWRAA